MWQSIPLQAAILVVLVAANYHEPISQTVKVEKDDKYETIQIYATLAPALLKDAPTQHKVEFKATRLSGTAQFDYLIDIQQWRLRPKNLDRLYTVLNAKQHELECIGEGDSVARSNGLSLDSAAIGATRSSCASNCLTQALSLSISNLHQTTSVCEFNVKLIHNRYSNLTNLLSDVKELHL